ncbi:probable xyloglucan endotransglucosylase/hydrolase protein 27 [Vitis riparia]|uniref:probable xyloglucan endotransglucosylase/hydrolase protein 27 n=1 Tax=Vitis riparia TaxID=96939 RepID=UPI00155A9566|nr:probable xyloglucan endotransglucosylase/hydrolase protein 27 [Vitis riparia]
MNQDRYSKNQDEVTFEILGNVKSKEWAVQTNVHGNTTIRNSTSKGREERYTLRFNPSVDFHKYSIFWTENHIIFYVDDVPIRLFMRIKAIGNYFIASPMYVHGSIWDKSDWATDGGKQKVDYRYGPFTATFSKLILLRFPAGTIDLKPIYNDEDPGEEKVPTGLTGSDITQMRRFRHKLKQLAQTITGSPPKNLGLDNSVSDAVKGVSLSSHLVDTLHATPPTPSPAPSPEPHDYTGPSPSPYANLSASYPSVLSPDTHHA